MNTDVLSVALMILCFGIAGCAEGEEQKRASQSGRETVFQPQIDALDKARGVEKMLLESSEEQRKLLESQ